MSAPLRIAQRIADTWSVLDPAVCWVAACRVCDGELWQSATADVRAWQDCLDAAWQHRAWHLAGCP